MIYSYVVVGAGSAGSVVASRLSENGGLNVALVEAGIDYTFDNTPGDIADSYAGRALGNSSYFWDHLSRRGNIPHLSKEAEKPYRFEQAKIIGGGSSINGQVAIRGLPADFDCWQQEGAEGWDWNGVLPYFIKLEHDLNFKGELHGDAGPMFISRHFRDKWDPFTEAVGRQWEAQGHGYWEDMNTMPGDGFAPIPLTNDGHRRISTADGYLTSEARARPNLSIFAETEALKVEIDEACKVKGVWVRDRDGRTRIIEAERVVLCAGAFRSPWLLLKSGIGPGSQLQQHGIPTLVDRKGVGANLQDHATVGISAYLTPPARASNAPRRNVAYLRHTSTLGRDAGLEGDLVTMAVSRSAWHEIGLRLGTLSTYLGTPYSRGRVSLSKDPRESPRVEFCWLTDQRDRTRAVEAFKKMAYTFKSGDLAVLTANPFASGYNSAVRKLQEPSLKNRLLTTLGASIMDLSEVSRRLLIDTFIKVTHSVDTLLKHEELIEECVCQTAFSSFHPVGTCKMGAQSDPMAVVDSQCEVIGCPNLFVADASIMPSITRTNTNLPAIMIGEKFSDMRARRS